MPLGITLLTVTAILIFLGLGHRVLDRLKMDDKTALLFIVAMLVGGFIPDIPLGNNWGINIGGGLVPIVLVLYLIVTAGTRIEKMRAIIASLVTGVIIYTAAKILPTEPTYSMFFDPLYVFALIAGVAGYLAGRSRRTAFIAGVSGIILLDIFSRIELLFTGGETETIIGGAGVFDAIVIAGFVSLGIAEIIGETREKAAGGPEEDRPADLKESLSLDKESENKEGHHEENKNEEDDHSHE